MSTTTVYLELGFLGEQELTARFTAYSDGEFELEQVIWNVAGKYNDILPMLSMVGIEIIEDQIQEHLECVPDEGDYRRDEMMDERAEG